MSDDILKRLEQILTEAKNNGILTRISHLDLVDKEKWGKAFQAVLNNIKNRPSSSYKELNVFRKNVPILLYAFMAMEEETRNVALYALRMETDCEDKSHKRWSKEEDELLIEWVCSDVSITKISLSLGRTVPAIKTRLTYLVGIKRLSQKVAGKFIGEINGKQSEANLVGTIYKEGN